MTPDLYGTVADLEGNIGLVVSHPWPISEMVTVEWADRTAPADVTDLLTEYGACTYGGPSGSPDRCDHPTAPGHEYCRVHGGHDPLAPGADGIWR